MSDTQPIPPLGIITLGNELVGDDGAGIWIGRQIKEKFPSMWIRDLGTDLLGVQTHSPYPQSLIILDAASTGTIPGSIHHWTDHDVLQGRSLPTPHGLGPAWALAVLLQTDSDFAFIPREWIAIEIEELSIPFHLTYRVECACHLIVENLCQRIHDSWLTNSTQIDTSTVSPTTT